MGSFGSFGSYLLTASAYMKALWGKMTIMLSADTVFALSLHFGPFIITLV